ncbi:MAG: TolC family protein [Opitutaceae bacterium]|jgi:outer membrane protein TolC
MKTGLFARTAALLLIAGIATAAPSSRTTLPEPLDLKSALQFALENNFAIRQARERIRQQEGVLIEVRAQEIPQLTSSAGYSRNDEDISSSFPADTKSWSIALQVVQTVYAGGGVAASIKSAKLTREAAMLELQGVINDQLLVVRSSFYTVLVNRQKIAVQEENVKLLEEQLKTARNRYEAGASSSFDVLRAEVALANGRPPLIQARNDYRISLEVLRQAIGLSMTESDTKALEVVGSLDVGQRDDMQLIDAISSARANRPELQRVAKLAEASEQRVKTARSGYQPKVQLFGSYDWVKGSPSAAWRDRKDGWTAGVQSQWAIFDGRGTAGRVAQARSQFLQSKLSLEEITLAVDVEVRRAYSSMQEAWELVESTGKVVSQADEALRLANVRYGAGTATQLDVLTSQVALTEARLNQLTSFYGYNVALATLRNAIGKADSFVGN